MALGPASFGHWTGHVSSTAHDQPARYVNTAAGQVQRVYLLLTLLTTLAASFIWGVNTLFLLDAGLNNTEAFAANAFFSIGMVIFEVPTGVVADTRGRRFSFMLGAATLLVATLLYLAMWQYQAPFIGWALASIMLGLGFTFFSGATEAWLVDALGATGFKGNLETVFGRGQTIAGVAMLVGSVAGGVVAQMTSLGVPYVLRAILLGVAMLAAFVFMRDLGFTPKTGVSTRTAVKDIARGSIDGGLRNRPVRWMMLAAPFTGGVGFYAFYAMQPYLLELYGQTGAYGIAGLAAAIVAGAQIIGGLSVPIARRYFSLRTNVVLLAVALESILLVAIAIVGFNYSGTGLGAFFMVLGLLVAWALVSAIAGPIRQAFLNGLIASEQRATVLSFDSLMGSIGGTVVQPAMGRVADVSGYAASYLISGGISALALPFIFLARREKAPSDPIDQSETIAA
jgi:MFS family permease